MDFACGRLVKEESPHKNSSQGHYSCVRMAFASDLHYSCGRMAFISDLHYSCGRMAFISDLHCSGRQRAPELSRLLQCEFPTCLYDPDVRITKMAE